MDTELLSSGIKRSGREAGHYLCLVPRLGKIEAVPRLVHTPAVIQQCIIKHRDNFAFTLQQTPQQNMTLEVCHRLTPLLIPWSLLVRLWHKNFVKKQYINRNMSYLSERQCQFCVDRAVASTERRPLGLLMYNARHRQKPIEVV